MCEPDERKEKRTGDLGVDSRHESARVFFKPGEAVLEEVGVRLVPS